MQLLHDLYAEKSLLGCLLTDNSAFEEIASLRITPEDFYCPSYKTIYDSMFTLYKRREPVDYITLISHLTSAGQIDSLNVGELVGQSLVLNLIEAQASSVNIASYAKIVREKAMLRKVVHLSGRTSAKAQESNVDVIQLLSDTEREFAKISQTGRPNRLKKLNDCFLENLDILNAEGRGDGDVPGLTTGFPSLDNKLLGLQAGQLIILAARPGMGKTSLAINIGLNAYERSNLPIVMFSLEMLAPEVSLRIISQKSKVDFARLRRKNLQPEDLRKVGSTIKKIGAYQAFINDDSNVTIFDIQAECRRIKAEYGIGLIIVDYIQLMKSLVKESREQQIADISRGLKLLAKDLECPIIGLSQLNRSAEARIEKRPTLSDLRESGALEQDADIVLLIYRDEFYNPDHTKEKGIAEIIIAKNRSGEMGTIKVKFEGQFTNFSPLEFTSPYPVDRFASPGPDPYYDINR